MLSSKHILDSVVVKWKWREGPWREMDTQSEQTEHVFKGLCTEGQTQTSASSEIHSGLTVVQQKWTKF